MPHVEIHAKMRPMEPMTKEKAEAFARGWLNEWNSRQVETVLGRYADDCVFISTRAASFAHNPSITGKAKLRDYFNKALAGVPGLRFELDSAIWDPTENALAMVYTANIQGKHLRECEVFHFDANGRIKREEAFYGGTLSD
jgi:hypothetical protein